MIQVQHVSMHAYLGYVRDLDFTRLVRQGLTTNPLSWQGNVDYRKSALDYDTLGRAF